MSLKVLVIDDYPPAAEMLSLVMEMKGYDVKHTCKPLQAFEAMKDFIPDVVLCDINMPGVQGNELCAQMRQDDRLKETVFVAQTALSTVEAGAMIRDAGFHYHLVKPIDVGVLGTIIKRHFANAA